MTCSARDTRQRAGERAGAVEVTRAVPAPAREPDSDGDQEHA
jgi:hypothetical protein